MRDRWTRHASFPFPARFVSITSVRAGRFYSLPVIILKNIQRIRAFVLPQKNQVTMLTRNRARVVSLIGDSFFSVIPLQQET